MGQLETLRNGKRAAVLEALRLGNTRRAACRAAGINPDTLYQWMKTDPSLSDAVTRAEAEAEQYLVAAIRAAAPTAGKEGDWRAAESLLKRRFREDWGDSIDLRKLDDDQVIRLLERETAAGSGAPRAGDTELAADPADPNAGAVPPR